MEYQDHSILNVTAKRLCIQGYTAYSSEELEQLKYGIRFAYLGCAMVVLIGIALQSIPILSIAMAIAFLAIILPFHPFDYFYNSIVRHIMAKPAVPKRTNQGKFACGIATVCLGSIILSINYGFIMVANLLGVLLLLQAFAVGTIDYCVPSRIYNALFKSGK